MNPLEQLLIQNLQRAAGPAPQPTAAPALPPLPPGFQLEQEPAAPAPVDPPGTGFGRAVERGALRTASTLPQLLAVKDSTLAADMIDPAAILTDVLSQTSLGGVPPGLDVSNPDAAFAGLAQMGFPPQMVQALRDTYEIRVRDAAAQGADVGAVLDRGVQNLTAAADLQRQAAALPMSPRGEAFQQEFANAPDDLLSALGVFAQDPVGGAVFLGETAAESVPQIAAAGAAGLATRSPAVMAGALGVGGMAQEFGPAVAEFMQEKGIVLRTPEDAVALLRDNGLMQEAAARGIGRAYVVALSELAGQGLAGAPFKSAVGNAAFGVGTQAVTGAGGEALARAATGQEQSAKEILVEGLAEGVTAPAEVGTAVVQDMRTKAAAQPPAPAELPPLPPGFQLEQPAPAPAPAPAGPWNPAPVAAPTEQVTPTTEQVTPSASQEPQELPQEPQELPQAVQPPDADPASVDVDGVQTPDPVATQVEPEPEPAPATAAEPAGLDPNAVDELGNPLNPPMGGIVGGGEQTAAERRAQGQAGAQARGMVAPPEPTVTPAEPTAAPTYAPTNATGQKPLTPRGVAPADASPKEPTRFGAAPDTPAASLQAELDNMVAELDARREAAQRQQAEKPLDTQARFEREMDEIAAFVESRAQSLGLSPEEYPTLEYRLQRESGTTRFKVHMGRTKVPTEVKKGGRTRTEMVYQKESPFQTWRKKMGRSPTPKGAMLTGGVDGTVPSVGPRARFSDAAGLPPVELEDDVGLTEAETETEAEADDADASPDLPQTGPWGDIPDGTRTPRGGFTPDMRRVSFAEDGPVSEQAFRDAGLEPDAAVLLPPVQQRNVLSKLLTDVFGVGVDVRGDLNLREGIDQLLDAYRGMRAMAAVLQLPPKALSLGGRLRLTFEKFQNRYLGMYNGGNTTIHMPGRSNSFAHEWAHALDHFLRDATPVSAQATDYLLSQVTRADGLDPTDSLQAAFINLIHRMFFDEAALALRMMDLEQKAQKTDANGQPTKGAVAAIEQLEELRAGATRLRITPTAYRVDSVSYSPASSGYFASVHEMLARAFEAYIGHKLANAGVTTQNFVTKGDAAYLSDADRRLRMTFPKLAERVAIFKAFDDLFDHIRTRQLLGNGTVGGINPDVDVVDPAKWNKLRLLNNAGDPTLAAAKQEFNAARNALKAPVAALRATVSQTAMNMGISVKTPENIKALGRGAAWIVNSQRGIVKSLIARQPKAVRRHFQFLAGMVMTDPGTGSEFQAENYEEQVERSLTRTGSAIDVLLRQNGMTKGALSGALAKDQNDRLRKIMLDGEGAVQNATAQERAVAAGLRRMIDQAYRYGQKAGIAMGFVRDKGYLPRIILSEAVEANPQRFLEQAGKVYQIYFDKITAGMDPKEAIALAKNVAARANAAASPLGANPFAAKINALSRAVSALNTAKSKLKAAQEAARKNPANAAAQGRVQTAASAVTAAQRDVRAKQADLLADVRDPYASLSAEAWRQNVEIGQGLTFDTLGPAQDYKDRRVLPAEADDLLEEFYETDVLDLTMNYVHGVTRQAAYSTRFGANSEEFNTVEKIVLRQGVQDKIADNPRKYDVTTAEGQLNIIRDLADPTRDNIKEMVLRSAEKFGAESEAIHQMRRTIETITGRVTRGQISPGFDRAMSFVYMAGTIVALPRAMWTMLTEPLTFLLRTGDLKNTGRVMFAYAREAARGARDVRELQELSEMIGVVASPLHDAIMLNRVADGATMDGTAAILSRFFRANFMSQLTNAQRRSVVYGGSYMLRDMARNWQRADANTARGRADRKIVEADLRDLGVSDEQMEGFIQWLASGQGLPSLDDLSTDEGKVYTAAIARFVDTTIMNPRRADKPPLSLTSFGRLVFGLTSFIYAFTRNVHYATALRTRRNYALRTEAGMDAGAAALFGGVNDVAARLVAGFALLIFGQVVVGALRALIFDSARWEEKAEEEKLGEWLLLLGISRSGVAGGLDIVIQSLNGVRYERDFTSLTSGAYPAMFLGHVQNIVNGLPQTDLGLVTLAARNSPNTETAENKAVKAAYGLFLAPLASATLSALPFNGPVGAVARNAALQYSTSQSASQGFADQFFERGERQ